VRAYPSLAGVVVGDTYDGLPRLSFNDIAPSATGPHAGRAVGSANAESDSARLGVGVVARDAISDSTIIVRGGTADLPEPGTVFSGSQGATLPDAWPGQLDNSRTDT
jgi:hypothetical protein